MSMSPGSILAKLSELKKWQEKQQERLSEHHKQLVDISIYAEPSPKPKPKENNVGHGPNSFSNEPGEQFKPFPNEQKTVKPLIRPQRLPPPSPLQKPEVVLPKAVWENAPLNDTERELEIFETLEQQALNGSFSSTTDSKFPPTSTPQTDINTREKKIRDDYLNLIAKAMKFKNYMDTSLTPSSSVASLNTLQPDSYNDKSKWTDFEVESSASTSLTSEPEEELKDKCDAYTMTESHDNELNVKLNALEQELNEVCEKNVKGKKQLEQKSREFEQYKKEMTKQIEDEKIRIKTVLEDEKKKLAKEKMVFEKYTKDLHNKPTRKEREEIAALKTEIATLKETLKLKESRNGTTQARLRNQIKSLEKENLALKSEIEDLNKRHAKLVVQQRLNAKPTNTKLLHEMNKNLSKLADKQFRKHIETDESSSIEEEETENNKNISNSNNTVEEIYRRTFTAEKDRTEHVLSDGTKQIKYSNGNIKNVSSDGNIIIFQYFNGDVKETNLLEGTIRYHYSDTKVNHTTNADGSELIQFPDGQIEKRFKGGGCEIEYPNGIKRKIHEDNSENVVYPDGTIVNIDKDKRTILLPNGQKEIHTDDYKRREYPDGTVKILYPDGKQETRYSNGRVRMKDKNGKLIMDSQQ
ncbi:hypothetical protein FQR65_LT14515 [Abscondita terminalis]|nr:hypothetical protein FQR65_LT14515 [Abscondita terminalis]